MSDPLWFLDNLQENETKSEQNDLEQKKWVPEKITSFPGEDTEQYSSKNQENFEAKTTRDNKSATEPTQPPKSFEIDLLKDEDSLRNALQSSLLESIKNGQNPEIQITVNGKPQASLVGEKSGENNNVGDASQNEKSKILITLNQKENGQVIGEDKKFVISSSNEQKSEVGENGSSQTPKVYVILSQNQNGKSNINPNGNNSNNQYFEEIGSTVINLNDLLSSQEKVVSNNGNITANVDLSSIISSSEMEPKVELVIKVKDEREKDDQASITEEAAIPRNYSSSEISRLQELLKSSATLESLDSQLMSGKEVRNIPITVTPAVVSQTTSYESVSNAVNSQKLSDPSVDWEEKSTDSYVRRDGAQCTRTVWNSPQGRRVETKCVKDESYAPRGRRMRDQDWSPRLESFFNDIDGEFNRLTNYARRFFY